MLSRCFHFGFFEIFVSSLFLLVFLDFCKYWLSVLYNSKADYQEEDHDGRRCLHLPGCSCTGPSSVLRTLTIRQNRLNSGERHDRRDKKQPIRQLPHVQGTPEAAWIHGHTGTLYHMGGYRRRSSHPRLHHRVLLLGLCGWLDCPRCFPLGWCSSHLLQAEEGTAHQEGRPWSIHLCLFNEDVNPKIQVSTNEQVCHNLNHL